MRTTPRLAMLTVAALVAAASSVGLASTASAASLPAPEPGAEVYLRPADGAFDVAGGGYGHGIGMSQYGAQGAATKGLDHTQILGFYYPGAVLKPEAPTSIKIGITIDNDGIVQVGARPGLAITIAGTTTTLPTGPTQWRVRATGTTVTSCAVESLTNGAWSVYGKKDATPCPVEFSNPVAGPDQGTVDLFLPGGERRNYRGTITAFNTGTTKLSTVNGLSMQDYLRGVVPSEMPPSWKLQALKSQAVAARTYAATRSKHTDYYDTCDTTSCQVYKGRGKRNSDGTITSYEWTSTNTAINETDGQVLKYGTALATTMYSSSNGGRTVAVSGYPYLPAKNDPYDGAYVSGRPHAWSANLPVASLEKAFGIARVERVQILTRDGSGDWGGRVLSVKVDGFTSAGAYISKDATGNGIMGARPWPANSDGLSSNYFTIEPELAASQSTADFDGDGNSDILARVPATGDLRLYRPMTGGALAPGVRIGTGWNVFSALETPGDLSGDGSEDVLARERATGRLWLYPGDGKGGWLPRVLVGTGWNALDQIVGPGDFDGDNSPDVLARGSSTGDLYLYAGTGTGGLRAGVKVGTGWQAMDAIVGASDLTGDGFADVVARERSTGYLWLYPGNGKGGWLNRVRIGTGWNVMTSIMSPGDLNRDGTPDLVARDGTGVLWLYPRTASGGWLPRMQIGSGWNSIDAIF